MTKTTKSLLITLFIIFLFFLASGIPVKATNEDVLLDEDIQAEDLETDTPTLLPDNPFYLLKNWMRNLRSFFAFDPLTKARLRERFTNERLMELKEMIKEGKDPEDIKAAIEAYKQELEEMKAAAQTIQENAQENEEVGKFLDKFTQHQALHQRLLQKLEEQVPAEVFEKIKEARENHLEKFKDVILKLENKDEITETLEENLGKLKGSKFKDFKNLEILDQLKEKLPEDVQEQIELKKEEILERLRQQLEELSAQDQELFEEYLDQISGDKLKQLYILTTLEGEELSEKLQGIMEKARERYIERIENQYEDVMTPERAQEKIDQAEESLTEAKELIIEKDIQKEEMTSVFRLVTLAEEKLAAAKTAFNEDNYGRAFGQAAASLSLSRNVIRLIEVRAGFKEIISEKIENICSAANIPVCGEDGKTYTNICEAKKVDVTIAYRGECQTELPCAKEGQRINRNPLLGPTFQVCCQGLEEVRISRTYSVCKKPEASFECQVDEDCPLPRCPGFSSKCIDGKCLIPRCQEPVACIQVITPAKNPLTNQCREFPTPCDVPEGWIKVDQCPGMQFKLELGPFSPKTAQ